MLCIIKGKTRFVTALALGLVAALAVACSSDPEIIRETVIVDREVEVQVESTVIVEREVEKLVTPTSAPSPDAPPVVWAIAFPEDVTTTNIWDVLGPGSTAYNSYAFANQYPTLMGLSDQRFDYVPVLAADFPTEPVEEGAFWTSMVELRDAEWSDGTPITAADFAFTVDTVLSMELPGNWATDIDAGVVDHVEAVDDKTAKIYFKQRPGLARWQFGLAQSTIVAKHYWEPIVEAAKQEPSLPEAREALYAHTPQGEPVAGEFIFSRWEEGAFVVLDRNDRYFWKDSRVVQYANGAYREISQAGDFTAYGEASGDTVLEITRNVQPQSVSFSVYGSQDAAILALRSGEVDYFLSPLGLSAGLKKQVEGQPGITTVQNPKNGFRFLGFNMRREPMNVPEFREAVATLIDKEFLAERILQNAALPIYTLVPEGNGFWWNGDVPQIGKGLTREERINRVVDLLTGAGFTWDQPPVWDPASLSVKAGKGLQYQGNTVEEMEILTPSAGYDPLRATTGIWVERWLNEAGIPVKAELTGFNVIVPRVFEQQDFDMWILGWDVELYPTHLVDFFTSDRASPGDLNTGGYSNPEFDALAEEFLAETDLDRAREKAFALQEFLATDLPYVVLWAVPVVEAYRSEAFEFAYTDVLNGVQSSFQNINGPLSHSVFE